ncbi:MAG: GNAT family N-acetyltransferase [Nocardioides sp.]
MSPVLSTRPATAADVDVLRALYRRSSLSNAGDRAALLAAPDALEWTGDHVASGGTLVAVDEAGVVLGFATVVPLEEGLELDDLFVDPDHMRRGVATRLVSALAEDAVASGKAWLDVTANPHAAAFYASAGFVERERVETRFGVAARLRLSLGPSGMPA